MRNLPNLHQISKFESTSVPLFPLKLKVLTLRQWKLPSANSTEMLVITVMGPDLNVELYRAA